jgi:hypothetical protein
MGTGKVDRQELIRRVEECLEQFRPDNEFLKGGSFLFVVVDYLFPITGKTIDFFQWREIYRAGKTAEDIVDELLSTKRKTDAGKGGRRGISRQRWNLLLDAEEVIIFGARLFRKFDPNITMGGFAALLQAFCRGESLSHLSQEARAFIKDSIDKLLALLEWWTDSLKGDDSKRIRALRIVAEDIVGADKTKRIGRSGRQLTKEKLWSEVKKVLEHTAPQRYARAGVSKDTKSRDRNDERKDKRFYADSRFYYVTTLIPLIYLVLGIKQKEPSAKGDPLSSQQ